ncbi:hypothetical protein RISK_001900 [Rhodopirellula islandica]|uniref:Uncharacterized protein n=1 Tax=Rhodopirellula islandica TaxID=595434 RepID=A0A0J1EKH0_RHOIS|nr:hypothetical protein RISK_001900 [Rhodopirellula islandica]
MNERLSFLSCSQALPGNTLSWRLCLPVVSQQAEPAVHCVPRQSLGTRKRLINQNGVSGAVHQAETAEKRLRSTA